MGSSRHENVNKLLEYYYKCQRRVDSYKTIIKTFLETLQSNYNSKQNLTIKIGKFYRVGSSYEETVVHPQADFDIGMILSNPYSMESFSARKTDEPGLYLLKRVPGCSFTFPHLLNSNNFLKVEELKHKVCQDLLSVLKSMSSTQGFKIHAKETYSGVAVELRKLNHDTLKLDIIPQIEGNPEKDLPDWNVENISKFIKHAIKEKRLGVFFTLSAPPSYKNENKGINGYSNGYGVGSGGGFGSRLGSSKNCNDNQAELIVQANFTIIEKEYLLHFSKTAKGAIRISKGLLFCNPFLKTGGLRSYQIKRVALQYEEEIDRTNDSWDGYKILMEKYIQMLLSGGVDGYLIKNQDCLWKNERKCKELGRRLRCEFQKINLQNVFESLVTDWDFYKTPELD